MQKFTDEEITRLKALVAFMGGGPAPQEKEAEAEPEDELDGLDRAGLKKVIADEELDVKVVKTTTEDAIRAAIREARGAAEPEGGAAAAEEEEFKELAVGTAVKFKVKGKTHTGKVTAIDYDNGKVKVKSDTDKKAYEVTPDDLFE